MSQAFSNASIGLMPTDVSRRIDAAELCKICRDLRLCGEPIDLTDSRYFAGERFLEQINFLGCSPHIRFDAEGDDTNFTHIILHQSDLPRLYHGRFTRAPFCRQCSKANKQWQSSDHNASLQLTCEHCGHEAPLSDYDWRRTAGVSRILIEITDIFPKEAIPQPALLTELQTSTGFSWDYFYF